MKKNPDIICTVCNINPGLKNGTKVLWNGFLDADTNSYVCFSNDCREKHYIKKFHNPDLRWLYSEMPVVIPERD